MGVLVKYSHSVRLLMFLYYFVQVKCNFVFFILIRTSTMPKSSKSRPNIATRSKSEFGSVTSELEVPIASDVVYRHIWLLKKFQKILLKNETIDSSILKCILNGTKTYWNISIRFWKAPNGKIVKNPLVVCLNLLKCVLETPGQAKIKYQFGIWDEEVKRFECCSNNTVALNLETNSDILSIGYINLNILKRHLINSSDIKIMLKLQIIQTENESNTLSDDMSKIIFSPNPLTPCDTVVKCCGENDNILKIHKFVISIRSPILATLITDTTDYKDDSFITHNLDMTETPHELAREMVRYLYTDRIDNLESYAARLLPLAARYNILGLKNVCERTLLDNMSPENIANILLLADECGCENLKKAALHYCEDNINIKDSLPIAKTLAWKVMELVNPELFVEACESICSSTSNIDSEDKN